MKHNWIKGPETKTYWGWKKAALNGIDFLCVFGCICPTFNNNASIVLVWFESVVPSIFFCPGDVGVFETDSMWSMVMWRIPLTSHLSANEPLDSQGKWALLNAQFALLWTYLPFQTNITFTPSFSGFILWFFLKCVVQNFKSYRKSILPLSSGIL